MIKSTGGMRKMIGQSEGRWWCTCKWNIGQRAPCLAKCKILLFFHTKRSTHHPILTKTLSLSLSLLSHTSSGSSSWLNPIYVNRPPNGEGSYQLLFVLSKQPIIEYHSPGKCIQTPPILRSVWRSLLLLSTMRWGNRGTGLFMCLRFLVCQEDVLLLSWVKRLFLILNRRGRLRVGKV